MTYFELNQPEEILIEAGRIAFAIGIPLAANPYRKNQNQFKLWAIGFKRAKYADDKTKLPNGRYRIYLEPIVQNTVCIRCNVPVIDEICPLCGDIYNETELEEK